MSTLSIIILNKIFYRKFVTYLSTFVRFIGGVPLLGAVNGLFKELPLGDEFKEAGLPPKNKNKYIIVILIH